MGRPARQFYEFGPFRLDATEHVLFRDGAVVPLKPKVFDTLLVLVENNGHVIGKDELMKTLWPDTVVEENNLNQNISVLRRALGDGENAVQYIETLPRRGYRFVASVRESRDQSADLVLEKHTLSSVVIEVEEHEDRSVETNDLLLRPAPRRRWWTRGQVLAGAALIAAMTVAGYFFVSSNSKRPETVSTIKSIAVLPFKTLGADGGDEYLGLGMTDALITRLGSIDQVIVRPTSAVRRYAAQEQDPIAAGREQRVDAVLDGSIQKAGDRIRLTLQLVSVADGRHLWTDKVDEKSADILTVEDRVSERVAAALSLRLSGGEKKLLAKRYTENAEAYQLYLKGRFFWNKRTEEGLKKAIECFQQAIEKDATYALAYAGLADSYIREYRPKNETAPRAKQAALKAVEIDDTLAEAHTSLAFIKYTYDWDWQGAEREFKRAIELNPNHANAHFFYGLYLHVMGRLDEAIAQITRAQELDPLSLIIATNVGRLLYVSRRYDQAIEQLQKTLEMDQGFPQTHICLGLVYQQEGRDKEALAEVQKAVDLSGRRPETLSTLGYVYAVSRRREAAKILDELKDLSKRTYVSPDWIAIIYAGLGERDQAFVWLEKAYENHELPVDLKVDPKWDRLRSDTRFAELLRRVGLAP